MGDPNFIEIIIPAEKSMETSLTVETEEDVRNSNFDVWSPYVSEYSDIYREAVIKFAIDPMKSHSFLISKGLIDGSPEQFANYIFSQPRLSKRRIGEFIGQPEHFNQRVCEFLLQLYNFRQLTLVAALRVLMKEFRLPGESQQIDRIMEKFSCVYCNQNSDNGILNPDVIYKLSFSIMLLNTDLHKLSYSNNRMSFSEFVKIQLEVHGDSSIPLELLRDIYHSVQQNEIKMRSESDMFESDVLAFIGFIKSGWIYKRSNSKLFSRWKRYWFILSDGCLYYLKYPTDKIPTCIIPLDDIEVVTAPGQKAKEIIIASASKRLLKSSKVS